MVDPKPFDIDRFMTGSGKVDLSDIAWEDVPKYPLHPAALKVLKMFLMTESSTFFYLKTLMQTKAAVDEPEFAPFLSAWCYEEEFHGRAFKQFFEAYGEKVDSSFRSKMFRSRTGGEVFEEIAARSLAKVFERDWPAVHMAFGAIQELTTYHSYQALAKRAGHPILTQICQRIMKQELRHFAFYFQQAKKRLDTPAARRTTEVALRLSWSPVGDGMCSRDYTIHAMRYLFDGMDGAGLAQVEKKFQELPGMEWFDLLTRFAKKYDIHAAPRDWFPVDVDAGRTIAA